MAQGQTLLTERTEFGEVSGLAIARFARSGDDLILARSAVQLECRRRTSAGEWEVSQLIDPPPGGGHTSFGLAIALSGHRLAITAGTEPGLRDVLVYERPDASSDWALAQTLVGVGDPQQFGHALSIAGDRLFASAPGATAGEPGAVHVFRHDLASGLWLTEQVLTAAGSERLGESFAATPWVVVASDRTGRLVPFHYFGAVGEFVEQASLVPTAPGIEFRPAMRFSQGELFVAVSHAPGNRPLRERSRCSVRRMGSTSSSPTGSPLPSPKPSASSDRRSPCTGVRSRSVRRAATSAAR